MPDYTIHADFDHDGRLTGSTAERAMRQQLPGAVLVANLDVDARASPGFTADRIELDHERRVKSRSDDELIRLSIHATGASDEARMYLRMLGWLGERMHLYTQDGRCIRAQPSMPNVFELLVPPTGLRLALEAPTLPGTPLFLPSGLGLTAPRSPFRRDEGLVRLELYRFDDAGEREVLDWALFSVAPLIFPDSSYPARRVFICEIPRERHSGASATSILENQPSISDVEAALSGTGTALVRIPHEACQRDGWIQDQLKIGFTHWPGGVMDVVMHMPRMMVNALPGRVAQTNLADFVSTYFPSRQIGLFDEFWRRSIRVVDTSGTVHQLGFRDSWDTFMVFARLYGLRHRLVHELRERNRQAAAGLGAAGDVAEVLVELPGLLRIVVDTLTSAQPDEPLPRSALRQWRASISALRDDLQARARVLQTSITLSGRHVALDCPAFTVELTADEATRLYDRLSQIHDASNYGGNFESSPPVPGAPYGKIVLGNHRVFGVEYTDPDLIRFLQNQQAQPIVEVNVSWLHVGHIDEILTFAPCTTGAGNFAILRASPAVALEILREAAQRHLSGLNPDLSPGHVGEVGSVSVDTFLASYSPRGLDRTTRRGSAPVSQMLRGKFWLHHHTTDMPVPLEPPLIYRRMSEYFARQGYQHLAGYSPGPGEDRFYSAGINIFEFHYFEEGTNAEIDALEREAAPESGEAATYLQGVDRILTREFSGVRILRLPVLFDAVSDWVDDATSAFTPNLVNMQIVGNRAIVPRPYGPRMQSEDAVAVLGAVFDTLGEGNLAGRLSDRWLRERNLVGPRIWVCGTSLDRLADQFMDGFPGLGSREVERLIRSSNPGSRMFDRQGSLRPGWHQLTIPEQTVDLFEAYTQVTLESIGMEIYWVDSWHYHTQLGEIHCGTNVQREVSTRGMPPWWETIASR